ncbi:TIGR02302 family protein [Thioclava sp. SK-1]|uniref:TIGR02302 family protein n=1 Tax=Thioclava sp. SK-1 TaxID=1889770 RepID=UPI0008249350|nr:TIGR02302 family protein [Thioclava sp. SK-1]OCX61034.1 TIGR02302 family protein [Thioclava sp. SK-1]
MTPPIDQIETSRRAALRRLARPLLLTRLGMYAERGLRAFWPCLSVLAVALAFGLMRLQDLMPLHWAEAVFGLFGLGFLVCFGIGLRGFHRPTRAEAEERLDRRLPGRPIAALQDGMALGRDDAAARALWAAHMARMAQATRQVKPVRPAPDLSPRDPYGLRLTALTALVVALLFGAPDRLFEAGRGTTIGSPVLAAMGPSWEGWAEPPRYTGKPGLYLNSLKQDRIELPEGTQFSFRFYGAPGTISFSETVTRPKSVSEFASDETTQVEQRDFEARESGYIEIAGAGGRRFDIEILSDDAPSVSLVGLAERRADGQMAQPFRAQDDYAITQGQGRITLDLAALDRRYGLALPPEPRDDLIVDLPLPFTGSRADFTETLVEDAAKHPWANLPVRLELTVEDGLGQVGTSGPQVMELPGKRFFDPLANALIEARRDILWSRDNASRVSQWLRAVSNRPGDIIRKPEVALMLRATIGVLEADEFTAQTRDKVADNLWDLALLLEDGGLADALAAMQQAQERLSEAIRNGASQDEINKLMSELKQATDNYLKMLAERSQDQQEGPQFGQNQQQNQQISGDQIQQMMDEIQRLMEEGRMAEAQEMLNQLARMMENLQVTQGQGQGDQPGDQSMQSLRDTLRDQQELSDDSFRELQDGFEQQPGQGQPQQGQNGQSPNGQGAQPAPGQGADQGEGEGEGVGQGPGQGGQQPGNGQGQSLAQRQKSLRQELGRQQGLMPRFGSEAGDAARQSLDDAGRAMEQAEEALRDGNNGRALDRQADAIEALREGMRALGEAMSEDQARQQGGAGEGQDGQGQRFGDAGQGSREMPRDPLGRSMGQGGRLGSEDSLLQGEDVYRRARDLLDEIRRRSGERLRPEQELDYLDRLLDRF